MTEPYDVAVVGGGPAGSTTATLLAQKGYSVLLLEKEKFPRYHIGESTVPAMLPVLEELGVSEEVKRHGFVVKNGIIMVWGRDHRRWNSNFAEIPRLAGSHNYAFQVVRSEFDAILLNAARRSGVMVLEDTRVMDFLFTEDRCNGLKYVLGSGGAPSTVHARFVVDASGQNALLARKKELLEWDEALKNVAIWAYYQGGKALEGNAVGNILVEHVPEGWLWVIPLHDGTRSVGLVMPAKNTGGRQRLEEQFEAMLSSSTESKRLLVSARRVSDYHTARDWSYKSKTFYGPGFLLVGDAAGFVDPLFSSGVFLALRGGHLAAETIDCLLKEPEKEHELLQEYEQSYRDFFDVIVSFIHYFYETNKDKEAYWEKAQQLIDPIQEMSIRHDFILMISGEIGIRNVMMLKRSLTTNNGGQLDLEHAVKGIKAQFLDAKKKENDHL